KPGSRDRRVEHGAALVELRLVLGEVRGHDVVTEPDAPAGRLAAAEQGLEQRRLAGAVRPDERDMLAADDRERRLVEESLVACLEPQALDHEDVAARAGRLEELEAERPSRGRGSLDPLGLDPLDLLQLRLRLPGLR